MEEEKMIYKSIANVMGKVEAVVKSHFNREQNYKFRSIDDVYNACNKAMSEEKIIIAQKYFIISNDLNKILNKYNQETLVRSVVIQGDYKIFAKDGSFIEISTIGEAIDRSDKAFNKAMSQAFKYALFQVFMIPTEEEKDTEFSNISIPENNYEKDKNKTNEDKKPTAKRLEVDVKVMEEVKNIEGLKKMNLPEKEEKQMIGKVVNYASQVEYAMDYKDLSEDERKRILVFLKEKKNDVFEEISK